jgi:hypothetical protein
MDVHVYALRSWTIKKRGDEFFIAPSAQDGTHCWRGPYRTLARATCAIARRLQWEFVKRLGRSTAPAPHNTTQNIDGGEHEQDRAPQ